MFSAKTQDLRKTRAGGPSRLNGWLACQSRLPGPGRLTVCPAKAGRLADSVRPTGCPHGLGRLADCPSCANDWLAGRLDQLGRPSASPSSPSGLTSAWLVHLASSVDLIGWPPFRSSAPRSAGWLPALSSPPAGLVGRPLDRHGWLSDPSRPSRLRPPAPSKPPALRSVFHHRPFAPQRHLRGELQHSLQFRFKGPAPLSSALQ